MRLTYFVAVALTGILACGNALAVNSHSDISKVAAPELSVHRELADDNGTTKRMLRAVDEGEDEDSSDDTKTEKGTTEDDEEDRDLIISTLNRPKYWRWFRAGMTPHAVQEILGLTGVRRLWKPIKRRVYDGYAVFYSEKCAKAKYRDFCRKHADL